MLGSRGPVSGVSSSSRSSMNNAGLAMPPLLSPPQQPALHFDNSEQQAPMDEFLDQIFSMPGWNEMSGGNRTPWSDFNAAAGTANRMGMDTQKLFTTMSLLPPGLLGSHGRDLHDGADSAHVGDGVLYANEDSMLAARLRSMQENQGAAGNSQQLPGIGSRGAAPLTRSPSVGSSGSEGSGGPQSPPPIAPTWRQPYVGGVPPLPMCLGQAKPETLMRGDSITSAEAHLLGKRSRDDDEVNMRENHTSTNVRDSSQSLFASFGSGSGQVAQTPLARSASQQALGQGNGTSSPIVQSGQGVSVYGSQGTATQAQVATGATGNARPRVRARRGQATDPHSIAERLRRERIAERMKALQELVPNSNKTDKASMLDEIIDYVKFLQLQVKVLSMSRLGGAGAVAPLVADLPSEGPSNYVTASIGRSGGSSGQSQDGLAMTERQVARLMEDDMGSAMQYLQSKGLCLMPISLATAISSTNSRSQGGVQAGAQGPNERARAELSATTNANSVPAQASGSVTPSPSVDADNNKGISVGGLKKDGRELAVPEKSSGTPPSSKSPKARLLSKGKEEPQRRSQ